MIQMLTTAFSALVGAYIGAYFTRQTQHHKWLLERRSESFASFLELLGQGISDAADIKDDKTLPDKERSSKLVDAYVPALNYARIVRLYIRKELRQEFFDCALRYATNATLPNDDVDTKYLFQIRDRIQEIFEQELSNDSWVFIVRQRLKSILKRLHR